MWRYLPSWGNHPMLEPSTSQASMAHLDHCHQPWSVGISAWLAQMSRNTLNLEMIRLTCPHLLGPAHNCNDLFLLSKLEGMRSISSSHSFVCLSFSLFSAVSALQLAFRCASKYVRQIHLCTFVCVHAALVCLSVSSLLALTTYQHGHVLKCQMLDAPSDGMKPQGLEQTNGLREVQIGPSSIASQWTCLSPVSPSLLSCSTKPKIHNLPCFWHVLSAVGTLNRWSHLRFFISEDLIQNCKEQNSYNV